MKENTRMPGKPQKKWPVTFVVTLKGERGTVATCASQFGGPTGTAAEQQYAEAEQAKGSWFRNLLRGE